MSTNQTNGNQKIENMPVHRIRAGAVEIAIWENESQKGYEPMYAARVQRSYTDADGKWHNTTSLQGTDLLVAAQLSEAAWRWIVQRKAQLAAARKQAAIQNGGTDLVNYKLDNGQIVKIPRQAAEEMQAARAAAGDRGEYRDMAARAGIAPDEIAF